MKKLLILLPVLFMLLISDAFTQTVYITKSGKKYHTVICSYIKDNPILIE